MGYGSRRPGIPALGQAKSLLVHRRLHPGLLSGRAYGTYVLGRILICESPASYLSQEFFKHLPQEFMRYPYLWVIVRLKQGAPTELLWKHRAPAWRNAGGVRISYWGPRPPGQRYKPAAFRLNLSHRPRDLASPHR